MCRQVHWSIPKDKESRGILSAADQATGEFLKHHLLWKLAAFLMHIYSEVNSNFVGEIRLRMMRTLEAFLFLITHTEIVIDRATAKIAAQWINLWKELKKKKISSFY